ncbi:HECT domain [Cinara cedri]|uniref:HECT domain n=1 Tax=Cinara cedri TaxID=506608 RepID=A0A5E4NQQ6_9HEMI|nr:HECT domain [Cinara cedri]
MSHSAMDLILEFLRSRNIPDAEEICQKMDLTKVDINVLAALTEYDFLLYEWLPKDEDRMALIDWAKEVQSKEGASNVLPNIVLNDSFRESEHLHVEEKVEDVPVESTLDKVIENNEVKSIRVQIGWIHYNNDIGYEQIINKLGGGIREVECSSTSTVDDILRLTKIIFFGRENITIFGAWDDFNSAIVDFEQKFIENSTKVEDLLDLNGKIGVPRCYLVTRDKALESFDIHAYIAINHPTPSPYYAATTLNNTDPNILEHNSSTDTDTNVQCASSSTSHVLEPFTYHGGNIPKYHYGEMNDEGNGGYIKQPTDIEKNILVLHRGSIFKEMVEIFKNRNKHGCGTIYIELLHPNGHPEQGVDTGGVLRDTLSEFWTTMYETCTIGIDIKIPCISHTFKEEEWRAIAKIFYVGWINTKYLPIKLAMPILEQMLIGQVTSELVPPFLQTLSINDRNVLSHALENFTSVNQEDLITILGNLECRVIPNENNLKEVLEEIAYKELVQKPHFIIKQFQLEFDNLGKMKLSGILTKEKLYKLYKSMEPTVFNILNILVCEYSYATENEIKIYGYLKKFIKSTTDDFRLKFVRFCTGSDVITDNQIVVRFSDLMWYNHYAPIAHTCSCILQLPLKYKSYEYFQMEMDCILSSNCWTMDTY